VRAEETREFRELADLIAPARQWVLAGLSLSQTRQVIEAARSDSRRETKSGIIGASMTRLGAVLSSLWTLKKG